MNSTYQSNKLKHLKQARELVGSLVAELTASQLHDVWLYQNAGYLFVQNGFVWETK